ncbi:hypothetical protein P7B02_03930 [Caulobacter segnis]|uniref:hypothetical protein n=1 Tax=Caulobacter segnis TaxID=88688 RepID=UPI0024104C8B|nr:hypothetical protein [Caulobacter segnis]MDG2520682.1 hypothetical protein [Caulobacter segnis]
MRFWLWGLGGLLIWALHFLGLYGLASVADLATGRADGWRAAGLGFSLACLLATALYAVMLARRLRRASNAPVQVFALGLGLTGGLVAAIGVVFQSLPLLLPV